MEQPGDDGIDLVGREGLRRSQRHGAMDVIVLRGSSSVFRQQRENLRVNSMCRSDHVAAICLVGLEEIVRIAGSHAVRRQLPAIRLQGSKTGIALDTEG